METVSNYVTSQPSSATLATPKAISKNEGLAGREITSWTGYERNSNLRGQEGIRTYMRILNNNSTAWALYYVQYVMLSQVGIKIKPGKNKKSTQILEESLKNIKVKDLFHKASLSLPFGFALMEVQFEINESGRVIVKKLGHRPQSSIESWGMNDGEYVSAIQNTGMGKYVEIPLWKCLHFKLMPGFDDSPEGRSQLRTAVRPFQYIETIQETEGIGIDRDLTGIPKLEVPMEITLPTASEEEQARYTEAKKMVASVRQGQFAGLVLPSEERPDGMKSGWRFSVVTSGGSKLINTNEIVKRYEVEILMIGLFEVLILGMQGKPGSNALASEQTTFGAMAIGTAIGLIFEELNRLRDKLMILNGIDDKKGWAEFEPSDIEKLDFTKIADFVQKMKSLFPDSVELSRFMHDQVGIPFDEKKIAEELEKKKQQNEMIKANPADPNDPNAEKPQGESPKEADPSDSPEASKPPAP